MGNPMLRLHSHHVAPLVLVLTLCGAAYAGDGKTANAGSYPAAKTGECGCAACELYKADVDTIVAMIASGDLPKEFCPDTPAEKVAFVQQHPSVYFTKLVASRPSDLGQVFAQVKTRF